MQVFTGHAQKRLGGDSCREPLSLSVQTQCPRCWTRTLGGGSFCLGCSERLGQVAVGLTAALPPSLRLPAACPTVQASPPCHELCPFSAGFYRCQVEVPVTAVHFSSPSALVRRYLPAVSIRPLKFKGSVSQTGPPSDADTGCKT